MDEILTSKAIGRCRGFYCEDFNLEFSTGFRRVCGLAWGCHQWSPRRDLRLAFHILVQM